MNRLFALMLWAAVPAAAQITGGGRDVLGPKQPVDEMFAKKSLVQFGTLTAGGAYGRMPSKTGFVYFSEEAISPVFAAGQGATNGYFLSYGELSYFDFELPPRLKTGLEWNLSAAYVIVDWSAIYERATMDKRNGDIIADALVGPAISYNPVDRLILDATVQFGLGAVGGSSLALSNYPLSDGSTAVVDDRNDTPAIGTARKLALRARYGGLAVSIEFHSNSGERKRSYSVSTSRGNRELQSEAFDYVLKTSMPTSRISFGFAY